MFGGAGLASLYQGQIDAQRRMFESQYLQGSGLLGGYAAGRQAFLDSYDYKETKSKSKPIKEELQDEVDEWLKDVL